MNTIKRPLNVIVLSTPLMVTGILCMLAAFIKIHTLPLWGHALFFVFGALWFSMGFYIFHGRCWARSLYMAIMLLIVTGAIFSAKTNFAFKLSLIGAIHSICYVVYLFKPGNKAFFGNTLKKIPYLKIVSNCLYVIGTIYLCIAFVFSLKYPHTDLSIVAVQILTLIPGLIVITLAATCQRFRTWRKQIGIVGLVIGIAWLHIVYYCWAYTDITKQTATDHHLYLARTAIGAGVFFISGLALLLWHHHNNKNITEAEPHFPN